MAVAVPLSSPGAVQRAVGESEGEAAARAAEVLERAEAILSLLPHGAITKPVQTLRFLVEVVHSETNSQQIKGSCMFCGKALASTGATKIVDHMMVCQRCPPVIQDGCRQLRQSTAERRSANRV